MPIPPDAIHRLRSLPDRELQEALISNLGVQARALEEEQVIREEKEKRIHAGKWFSGPHILTEHFGKPVQ